MIGNLEVDLRPKLAAVRDQGTRPTCLAHAVSASHEYVRGSLVHLSVEYLHYFATGGTPTHGSTMAGARCALEDSGQPEEKFCPSFHTGPPLGWTPKTNLAVFRRRSDNLPPTCENVEKAIRGMRAPVLGISLPRSFFRPTEPWVIMPGNLILGLHAVIGAGIGFHRNELAILIRNSWGIGWGDQGHALLTSEFLDHHLITAMVLTEAVAR